MTFQARAPSGQASADPAITLMKSRRRIAFTKAGTTPYSRVLRPAKWASDRHFAWQ